MCVGRRRPRRRGIYSRNYKRIYRAEHESPFVPACKLQTNRHRKATSRVPMPLKLRNFHGAQRCQQRAAASTCPALSQDPRPQCRCDAARRSYTAVYNNFHFTREEDGRDNCATRQGSIGRNLNGCRVARARDFPREIRDDGVSEKILDGEGKTRGGRLATPHSHRVMSLASSSLGRGGQRRVIAARVFFFYYLGHR